MKKIGVIGGMGPESSALFYKLLIKECQKQYRISSDNKYPEIFIHSIPIEMNQDLNKNMLKLLLKSAKNLECIGADFIVIPCNSAHYFYENLEKEIKIPLLSMIEETIKKVNSENYKTIGLIGTKITMNEVYNKYLNKYSIKKIVPDSQNKIIGLISDISINKNILKCKKELLKIIYDLKGKGAEAVILGCTELSLILNQKDADVKLFDTLNILAESTIKFAFKN